MAFPDRIERTVEIAHPPARVWAALTTAEGLSAWFGNEATIELRPGGAASMKWDSGHIADLRVERVEEPTVFGYTWQIVGLPEEDPRRTYVEFTLEAGLRCPPGPPRRHALRRIASPARQAPRVPAADGLELPVGILSSSAINRYFMTTEGMFRALARIP